MNQILGFDILFQMRQLNLTLKKFFKVILVKIENFPFLTDYNFLNIGDIDLVPMYDQIFRRWAACSNKVIEFDLDLIFQDQISKIRKFDIFKCL